MISDKRNSISRMGFSMTNLRIRHLVGLSAISLISSAYASTPSIAADVCYDAVVTVERTKANGQEWDAKVGNYAPDVEIEIDGISFPKCKDSYQCMAFEIKPSKRVVSVRVVDADAMAADLIGDGQCVLSMGACIIGQAKLISSPCQ
jgi:hypothetical protein